MMVYYEKILSINNKKIRFFDIHPW